MLKIFKYFCVALVKAIDKLFGFDRSYSRFSGKPLGTHAVNDAEVNNLAEASLIGGDIIFFEQQLGGQRMDILIVAIGIKQGGFLAEMR